MSVRFIAASTMASDNYIYRGDIIAGNSKRSHWLVFSRRPNDGERYEHVSLKEIPLEVQQSLMKDLKHPEASLPASTQHAKALVHRINKALGLTPEDQRLEKALMAEQSRTFGTRDPREART